MNIENLIITINNEKQKDNIIMEKDIIRINARIKGGMNNMEANKTRKEKKTNCYLTSQHTLDSWI